MRSLVRVHLQCERVSPKMQSTKKRTRTAIPANVKREICLFHEQNPKASRDCVIRHVFKGHRLALGRSTISDILKEKEKWLFRLPTDTSTKARTPQQQRLEDALFLWFSEARARAMPVSDEILITKAKSVGERLGVPETFSYSVGWLQRFKQRRKIRFYKRHGRAASEGGAAVTDARRVLKAFLRGYDLNDIYSMDESGLFFRMEPNAALGPVSGKKRNTQRLTVALCVNALGTDKRKPLVVWECKRPHCFERDFDPNRVCCWRWNENARMTALLFEEWLQEFDRSMRVRNRHVVLLLHSTPSHKNTAEQLTNVSLRFLPPDTTSAIQPLDAGIIRNFRALYRRQQLQHYVRCVDAGKPQDVNIKEALYLVRDSWQQVSAATISNCWRHCDILPTHPEPAGPGSEEANTTAEVIRSISEILTRLPGTAGVTPDSILRAEEDAPISETLADDGFVELARHCAPDSARETLDEDDRAPPRPATAREVRRGLESALAYAEQNPDLFGIGEIDCIRGLIKKTAAVGHQNARQTTLCEYFRQ
ncbi:tigger transposable element-derived protein 6-like [Acipenser ruthenus]|uniref:tigger transposable element-derived protein 6-like n=1 Tax=Acipenser ruthenus TaxID=7906 RepID=UPI0027413D5D|nr:tigger transposable element-derived protein 6-like [Acipenser ruthenus]